MFFVKMRDCVLYEVWTECLNVCYMEYEVQEINTSWTDDDVECRGEDDDANDRDGVWNGQQ